MEKQFNGRRYIQLYADLVKDGYKCKYDLITKYTLNERIASKTYSEADRTLLQKIKDKGKDIWRFIKELIKKFIIFLEEHISLSAAKIKLAEIEATVLARRISKISRYGDPKGLSYVFEKTNPANDIKMPKNSYLYWFENESLTELFKKSFGENADKSVDEIVRNITHDDRMTEHVWGIDPKDVNHIAKTMSGLYNYNTKKNYTQHISDSIKMGSVLGLYRIMDYYRIYGTPNEQGKNKLEDIYEHIGNQWKDFSNKMNSDIYKTLLDGIKNADGDVELISIDTLESYADKGYAPLLHNFIIQGCMLETVNEIVKGRLFAKNINNNARTKSLRINNENYSAVMGEVFLTSRKILLALCMTLHNAKVLQDIYFDFKKTANKLKNVPTSITNNYDDDFNAGVRLLLSRSVKAAHQMNKLSIGIMGEYTEMAHNASSYMASLMTLLYKHTAERPDFAENQNL